MSERRREVALAGHRGDTATARGALTDSDPAVRATAIGALERLRALDVTDLQRALEAASPVVRRRACDAVALLPGDPAPSLSSEARRVGKECVSPSRSRWSRSP